MPTRATMTVMGLYNFDNSLFDEMELPEGIDRDVAVMRILFDCATLELNLPHYDILKDMIGYWSKSNAYKWATLFNTTNLDYNPIWNVDANESETIERDLEGSKTSSFQGSNSNTTTNNLTDTVQEATENTRTLDTETNDDNTRTLDTSTTNNNFGKLAGFNSNTYNNVTNNSGTQEDDGTITDNRTITDGGTIHDLGSHGNTTTKTGTVSDSGTNSGSNTDTDTVTETITNTKIRHGNIGVTMTQQLIEAERNVAKFSIYEVISNDFKHYFCIMVY